MSMARQVAMGRKRTWPWAENTGHGQKILAMGIFWMKNIPWPKLLGPWPKLLGPWPDICFVANLHINLLCQWPSWETCFT